MATHLAGVRLGELAVLGGALPLALSPSGQAGHVLPQFHGHTERAAPASHEISYPVPTNNIAGRGSAMEHNNYGSSK